MADVVSRLGELMRENGDDQSSLARKIGCTPAAINQILTGRTQRSRLLPEIADLYDVALPYLLGRWEMRGRGTDCDRVVSSDERRLLNLTQRLNDDDRRLVFALISRLAGAERFAPQGEAHAGGETLHEGQQGYRGKPEGRSWGE